MKRKLSVLLLVLCLLVSFVTAYADKAAPPVNTELVKNTAYFANSNLPAASLPYDSYFTNEHGFCEDESSNTFKMSQYRTTENDSLFTKQNNKLLWKNRPVSGSVGNSEVVFFAVNNTVYRYHVKSRKIDVMFHEDRMETFYPITSKGILWKLSSSGTSAKALCSDEADSGGQYYYYDAKTKRSTLEKDPERLLDMTRAGTYTNLSSYSTSINATSIPLSDYPIGSVYSGSDNGSIQCRGFSWLVYKRIWGSYSYGYTVLSGHPVTSASSLLNLASYYGPGSRFNFDSPQYHSMIILKVSGNNIDVYHANWPNNGKVAVTRFDSTNFYERYKTFQHAQVPHL